MKIFRMLCFWAAFLVLPVWSAAQQRAFECLEKGALGADEGRALMEKVQARYEKVQSLQAKFRQYSFLAAMDTAELSSGEVSFLKPGMMRWDYSQPEKQLFLVKNETVWLYQEADRQVIINEFRKVLLSDLPVAFLMGIGSLKADFSLKRACRSQDGVVLELVPAKPKAPSSDERYEELAGFKLLVSPVKDYPIGAEVTHIGGNLTAILLSDLKLDTEVKPSLFEPVFPRGVDLNDLRPSRLRP